MSPRRRRLFEKLQSLYLWHRYAGLGAAVLVIWLAVTGIFLNHTEDLRLPTTYVEQDWLLDAYGIEAASSLEGYPVSGHWVTSSGDQVYIGRQRIRSESPLVGAVETGFGFALAFERELQLYTADAVLVETLPFTATTAPIIGIGRSSSENIVIETPAGDFTSDAELVSFEPIDSSRELDELEKETLPQELAQEVATDIRHHTLDWERVMLDLHSGRILGKTGIWIADAVAVAMLLLAISGVLVWFRRWRSRRKKMANG